MNLEQLLCFVFYLDYATSYGYHVIDFFNPYKNKRSNMTCTTTGLKHFQFSVHEGGLCVLFTLYLWNFMISTSQGNLSRYIRIVESSSKCTQDFKECCSFLYCVNVNLSPPPRNLNRVYFLVRCPLVARWEGCFKVSKNITQSPC